MKKRVISSLLCLAMVFSFAAIPAQATSRGIGIAPFWENCSSIALGISYSDGTVSWTGSILGYSDTTKITANYYLYKLGTNGKYTLVDSWTGLSGTRYILNSSGSADGTKGTYKLTLSGTVQSDSYSEPISSSCVRTFS